jgi:hypothetical protein
MRLWRGQSDIVYLLPKYRQRWSVCCAPIFQSVSRKKICALILDATQRMKYATVFPACLLKR